MASSHHKLRHVLRREARGFFSRLRRGRLSVVEWLATGLVTLFIVLPVGLTLIYRVVPPPLTSVMVIRFFEGDGGRRDWVPLKDIAPSVRAAVLASEDNSFCTHSGVDWPALKAAMDAEVKGAGKGGASTITMQTARNLMLWPQRSYIRKGLELYVATLIELFWPKKRILEVYLNIAEWGPGVFGIEAAAQHHFGVSAGELTQREAARLAVILPNPREFHATASTGHVVRQAGIVERRIGQLGPLLDCVK